MRDPITKEQHDQLFARLRNEYDRMYQAALSSGALSEEEAKEGSTCVAGCVLLIAAEKFAPSYNYGVKCLRNLRNFI